VIPPDGVLEDFEKFVKPWFRQLDVNNEEVEALSATRDYLLPKLLSREVAV
jgi:hypothetical protein